MASRSIVINLMTVGMLKSMSTKELDTRANELIGLRESVDTCVGAEIDFIFDIVKKRGETIDVCDHKFIDNTCVKCGKDA